MTFLMLYVGRTCTNDDKCLVNGTVVVEIFWLTVCLLLFDILH